MKPPNRDHAIAIGDRDLRRGIITLARKSVAFVFGANSIGILGKIFGLT